MARTSALRQGLSRANEKGSGRTDFQRERPSIEANGIFNATGFCAAR